MFVNRFDAGQQLAEALEGRRGQNIIIYAIPRGGVVVAAEVAKTLQAPLDLVIPRKIGAPNNPELAIGAIAGEGDLVLNEHLVNTLGVTPEYLEKAEAEELAEIERRQSLYLRRPPLDAKGRVAVVIDDGLATGFTALAGIVALRRKEPAELVMAIPVAPQETVEIIQAKVDDLVCLDIPETFYAVGQFYRDFAQVSDQDVITILDNLSKSLN